MKRAPFQILVLPFRRKESGAIEYAVFRRKDESYWQGIAGGGHEGETPLEAARRETREESGLSASVDFFTLKTVSSIPVYYFADHEQWGPAQYVIPAHTFACDFGSAEIELSPEHTEFRWVDFESANYLLCWDIDKTALWELNQRLLKNDLIPA